MNLPAEHTTRKKIGFASSYRRKGIATPDMTPMVDLGFLLIAFFVVTTELSKPSSLHLVMPKDGIPMNVGESNALSLLLNEKKIYYYFGNFDDAEKAKLIIETSFSEHNGIGKIIRDRQALLSNLHINPSSKDSLMLIIKPTPQSTYNSVIKSLDEALINSLRSYVVVPAEDREIELLDKWVLKNSNVSPTEP